MLGGTDDFESPAVATPAGQVLVRTAGGGGPECGS
ncbi:hypothetical protein DFQ13_11757 [Actinokineospora spheciospongiae]|nr:hypothetical protein DFQ13_11757 [Actinokineospora spheciospongiae]